MGNLLLLVGIVGIALIGITLLKKIHNKNDGEVPAVEDNNLTFWKYVQFKKKDIMTDTELKFFHTLVQVLQGYYIFPQVATHAILFCSASPSNKRYKTTASNKFHKTIIDYVVCDTNFNVIAVIELDDHTHKDKKEKDDARDKMLKQAGYKTVRFDCEKKYTLDFIRNEILN